MKAVITTVNSKRINMRCKIGHQNHKMWGKGVKNVDLLECVWTCMTISLKPVDTVMGQHT